MYDLIIATNSLILQHRLQAICPEICSCFLLADDQPIPPSTAAVFIDSEQNYTPGFSLSHYSGLIFTSQAEEYSDGTFHLAFSADEWKQLFMLVRKFAEQSSQLRQQQQLNHEMTQIGIALSSEKELSKLLSMILEEGRSLAHCEAASLYLVDRSDKDNPFLKFMLFQNERLDVPFEEKTFPLNHNSMTGYVALTNQVLNIPDVYQIDEASPYIFDDSFDRQYSYRTREVLTIPMRNHRDETIGVLQFLNRKEEQFQGKAFEVGICDLLMALASQSAVAIDNSLLIENIRDLFEGFVSASVTAIEARDPITSGHSFRVADYSCLLAEKLSMHPGLKAQQLTGSEMRELRYAALLHDFGKVGVRENVLQKAKKLNPMELELVRARIHWFKEKLRADFYQAALEYEKDKSFKNQEQYEDQLNRHEQQLAQLEVYLDIVEEANEPSVLPKDHLEKLETLKSLSFEVNSGFNPLITEQEFLALSVTKGSLTPKERSEIQSHVNHTFEFLKRIPWTQDLQNIPIIASAHHEKLDGSGYPFGLTAEDIPIQTRMMTIADIYDALTAADRPYKPALPHEKALSILIDEAELGKLDRQLVSLFIDSKAYLLEQKS